MFLSSLWLAAVIAATPGTAGLWDRIPEIAETRLTVPGEHPMYRALEEAWNQGDPVKVQELLKEMDARGITLEEYGLGYRTPRPVPRVNINGGPVPVSDSLNVRQVELVRDPATGALIAFLAADTNANTSSYHVLTLLSTDGGNTWMETQDWSGSLPYKIQAFQAAPSGVSYAYVVDIFGTDFSRMRRYDFSNGAYDSNFGNVAVLTAPDTLKEHEAFASGTGTVGYFLYLHSSGQVEYLYSSLSAPSFNTISTGVTNADHGLSGTFVSGQIGPVLFAYTDATGDTLFIRWRTGSGYGGTHYTGSVINNILETSVAARADTVLVVFDTYDTTNNARVLRYRISYGDTTSFLSGTVSTDFTHSQRSPRVIEDNGTFAVSWIYFGGVEPDSIVYRTRPVGTPSWSATWTFPYDYQFTRDHALVAMGSGVYGFLAVDDGQGSRAIFMASSWTDVMEPVQPKPGHHAILRRGVVRAGSHISLNLPFEGRVRVLLLDAMGRQRDVLFEGRTTGSLQANAPGRAGVYFLRVEHAGGTVSQRIMVIR